MPKKNISSPKTPKESTCHPTLDSLSFTGQAVLTHSSTAAAPTTRCLLTHPEVLLKAVSKSLTVSGDQS